MQNHRGALIAASAIIWTGAIWGMTQIKPVKFELPDISPPPIEGAPIVQIDTPPPPPPPEEVKEDSVDKPIKTPPIRTANPTKPNPNLPPQIYSGPPVATGIPLGDLVVDTAPPTHGRIFVPPVAAIEIVEPKEECGEGALSPRPRAPFNVVRAYPSELEEQEIAGLVAAIWKVDENGIPTEVRIASSSNNGFNDAVVREGMRMRFLPARKECLNTKGTYALNVKFELNGE